MQLALSFDSNSIILKMTGPQGGFLKSLFRKTQSKDFEASLNDNPGVAFAVADLKALADEIPGSLLIDDDSIKLSHLLASRLSENAAQTLGLPPLVHLTLKTDAAGSLGAGNFGLRYEWYKNGQRQLPQRVGCILKTVDGPRRIPSWMLEAIDVADSHNAGQGDDADWEALARFRRALEPDASIDSSSQDVRVAMTEFLQGLQVRLVDRFSISPNATLDDFDVIPFSADSLDSKGVAVDDVSENAGELDGTDLRNFQQRVRQRGALAAYRVAGGNYVVVDRSAAPVLKVMAEMQRASVQARSAFIRNPRQRISQAIEEHLRSSGKLDSLIQTEQEELIEATAQPLFLETREFSERVTGIAVFSKPDLDLGDGRSTTWLPEEFGQELREAIENMPTDQQKELRQKIRQAIDENQPAVQYAGLSLPANRVTETVLDELIAKQEEDTSEFDESDAEQFEDSSEGPVVLETAVNFDELRWRSKIRPRQCVSSVEQVPNLKTRLKDHQQDCFRWQVAAWRSGLPGVLNADEQGLGKTLETISFLSWLKNEMASPGASVSGPVLVVAPTSLLQNWEMEVQQHLEERGLGHLIRLFGAGLQSKRTAGAHGTDIEAGEVKLDLSALHEAVAEGRAHRFWVLTTYTTLANYQHSLGRMKFAAIVFDEIQALKNPASLRAVAARAMQADFRIGLTGTPIENSVLDLWAIMDQLAPGMFESLQQFRVRYAEPDENNMADLYRRVFDASSDQVPLAIRRIKDEVARDLPVKTRLLHPRLMPAAQAQQYDAARLSLLASKRSMALKVLHHIRTVSVHPSLHTHQGSDSDFVALSARLGATMDILKRIRNNGERALVFIEHRQMQYRFIALAKVIFGLKHIDLINGDTAIQNRQAIVNKFQSHLNEDGGFDLLVLGPKAAGTGLTLTAATHVIHLSRWWNPAVEEQCNDRVHRIGQTKNVHVHVPLAIHPQYLEHSFDCLLHSLMQRKRRIASSVLWPMGDTEADASALQDGLGAEQRGDIDEAAAVEFAMKATFARDGLGEPVFMSDGSIAYK